MDRSEYLSWRHTAGGSTESLQPLKKRISVVGLCLSGKCVESPTIMLNQDLRFEGLEAPRLLRERCMRPGQTEATRPADQYWLQ